MMAQDAADDVLSNPDLVYRILENLPPSKKWDAKQSDRGATSHVNRVFRQAALRLPWELSWGQHHKATPPEALPAVRRFLGSRNVRSLRLRGKLEGLASALCCATSLESLTLDCSMQELATDWAQHNRLQLEGEEGSSQPTSLTACLSLLSRLTHLRIRNAGVPEVRSASWLLAAAPQLQHLALSEWHGLPLEGGPHLKRLDLWDVETERLEGTLDQWAAPGLTTLSMFFSGLVLGPSRRGNVARELQRLHLDQCCFTLRGIGLQNMFPSLTYLFLGNFTEEWPPVFNCVKEDHSQCLDAVLRKGLPVSLRELVIEFLSGVGRIPRYTLRALSKLVHLESLELSLALTVNFWDMPTTGEGGCAGLLSDQSVDLAFRCLTELPRLRRVCLELPARNEALLQERCEALKAHLKSRGGCFQQCSFL